MSQFLEGDIRLSQRFAELNRQGLDLKQDTIDFNKKMLKVNTAINMTSAVNNLVSSVAGLAGAIDGAAKQRELKFENNVIQRANAQAMSEMQSGKMGWSLNENGQAVFSGQSHEIESLRRDALKQIESEMGGMKWGNAKRAAESLNQRFDSLYYEAAQKTSAQSFDNFHKELRTNLDSGIQEYVTTGNDYGIKKALEGARGWMSEETLDQYKAYAREQMKVGRIGEIAMELGRTGGMDAVAQFVSENKGSLDNVYAQENRTGSKGDTSTFITENTISLTEEQWAKVFNDANRANSQAVIAATEEAKGIYKQTIENGGSVRDSVIAATGEKTGNEAVNEARKEAAQKLQFGQLNEDFWKRMDGIESMSLERLQIEERELRNRRGEYYEQEQLYNQHMDKLHREIEQRQREARGSGGSGEKERSASNVIQNYVEEFHRGNIQGPTAIEFINDIRSEAPVVAANAIDEIFGLDPKKWNQRASAEYRNFTSMLDQMRPPANKPEERAIYDEESRQRTRAIQQAYYRNVSADDMAQLIRTDREALADERLSKVFERGNIGSQGAAILPGIQASEGATAFVYHSNRGGMDLRYSEQAVDPNNPRHTIPLTVGGEKAEAVLRQTANENRKWANDQLRGTGLTLDEYDPENVVRDERGDRDGVIHYKGSDGRTYRVDATDPHRVESRIIEVKVGNEWQRVDPRELRRRVPEGHGGNGGKR
jgi:hypothetical protein